MLFHTKGVVETNVTSGRQMYYISRRVYDNLTTPLPVFKNLWRVSQKIHVSTHTAKVNSASWELTSHDNKP